MKFEPAPVIRPPRQYGQIFFDPLVTVLRGCTEIYTDNWMSDFFNYTAVTEQKFLSQSST